jgi:hypothetical protein
MIHRKPDGDAAAAMLERRWFASITAARAMRAECETLREVMEMAESAWRRARTELVRLERLCDALGEELAEIDGPCEEPAQPARNPPSMISAA